VSLAIISRKSGVFVAYLKDLLMSGRLS